jgi:DNA-binding response OmpR family regulator
MNKILLLEDDTILAETLIELFESENYEITHANNGEDVLELTYKEHFDIYIFDVNVPLLDGFELLKQLRGANDRTPTIFLTALNDLKSFTKGFDVGADDYVKKPFDFDELIVRIHSLLKKQYNDDIYLQDFRFNLEKNELYYKDNFIALSAYELKLTHLFFKNIDHTLSKEYLIDELSYNKESSDGSLRVYINKLRKHNLPLQTIKGVGYRLSSS